MYVCISMQSCNFVSDEILRLDPDEALERLSDATRYIHALQGVATCDYNYSAYK